MHSIKNRPKSKYVSVSLKDKLCKNKASIGSWITLGHTSVAEIMSKAGFNWLVVDMEHSAITLSEAQQLIQVIELSGVVPLARVGKNDANIIKRVMDCGAHGVIVPMVNNREDALQAVSAVKYPPMGKRGVGLARAQGYGFEFKKYLDWVNMESIVIVQIEHVEAINNLEEILSVPEVDGSIIGPYDLSGSLGIPGKFKDRKMINMLNRYESISKKMNKAMGFHIVEPDAAEVLRLKRKGYSFLAVGLDTLYLGGKCREIVRGIR